MATSTTISKSFTSVSVSASLVLNRGETVTLNLSGTYAATVQLERANTPDETSWQVVLGPFSVANATVLQAYSVQKTEEHLRLRCTAYTSGTAVASMSDGDRTILNYQDGFGGQVESITQGGVLFAGGVRTGAPLPAGATLTMDESTYAGRTVLLDTAAGSVVTLPASTGNGATYRFLIKTKATSASHIVKVGNSTDIIQGIIETMSDDPVTMKGFAAAGTDDTITLNRTTTGSVNVGEWIEITDYAAGFFGVRGVTSSTGTEATPFSSTV